MILYISNILGELLNNASNIGNIAQILHKILVNRSSMYVEIQNKLTNNPINVK